MKLFYNYSIDCELPPSEHPRAFPKRPESAMPPSGGFGGPPTWEFAERSVREFIETMAGFGLSAGASLFVYPDVARKQKALYREMAAAGVEIALHLNTMLCSYTAHDPVWLGAMNYERQKEVLQWAKQELEDVIGQPCLGFRACYGSAGREMFAVLEELGFAWTSNSSGRWQPSTYSNWPLNWPFPHHASRHNLSIPGDLKLYKMPVTSGLRVCFQGNPDRPLDLRVETPPDMAGEGGITFRRVIDDCLEQMERCCQPVRLIAGASHNASLYADQSSQRHQNFKWVHEHALACAAARGYEFRPASFLKVKQEAERIGAF